ncbi:DUF3006 domain-containing protein [Selenihalanaerobacter shriftii]|uniref:DUF3006 domain-containing protein n=1 Tax=Selenihalanaerobacter shriftii TaxID=142842 RepID=A0A1T4ND31_9FIRM|nr:DUF3006 domain-containing protein [Selenihalanaerobacter shriftii]SJZ77164.1 Protein of unknown function [Selenihalanaerobacter shriftii]
MLIIDRFEGERAIIEGDKEVFEVPKSVLPQEAKAGDVIKIIVDKDATEERKKRIGELSDDLFTDE